MRYEDVKSIGGKTRYVFNAPKWWMSALLLAFISLLFGALAWGADDALYGLLILGLPLYLTTLLSILYGKAIKMVYWAKTDLLMSIATVSFSLIILAVAKLASLFTQIDMGSAVILSITIPVWVRHVFMSSISMPGQKKAFPISVFYPVLIFLGFFAVFRPAPDSIALFVWSSAASMLFASLFLMAVDTPMKNVLGVGGLEFTMWTVEHYKEQSQRGHDNLEDIFDRFGEEGRIFFNTVSFVKGDSIKGAMAVHTAHPGPVGDVGGGDMPIKLSGITGVENLVTPHGASTHDLNPTGEREVEKIGLAIRRALRGKKAAVSSPVRTEAGDISMVAQRFGDVLMVIETSYPKGTEDVDVSVALTLREKVRQMGYSSLIFIDAHNRFDGEAGETKVHSPKFADMEKAVEKAAGALKDAPLYPARVGFGRDVSLGMEHGVARMGVQSVVIDVNGKRAAYIVLDGNNMVEGLRERILSKIGSGFDVAEVMTTDNHCVNRTAGGKNPVGYFGRHEDIVKACERSLKMALEDLEAVETEVGEGDVNIRIFGPHRAAYMYSVPRAIDTMGRFLAFFSVLSLVLTDVLLAMLI